MSDSIPSDETNRFQWKTVTALGAATWLVTSQLAACSMTQGGEGEGEGEGEGDEGAMTRSAVGGEGEGEGGEGEGGEGEGEGGEGAGGEGAGGEGEGGATTTPAAGGNTEASTGGTEDSLLMNAMYPGGVRN